MNRNLPIVIIFDLDSTLFDTSHRHPMADEALISGDWDSFSLACIDDVPITGTVVNLRFLYPFYRIHLCSGRSEIAREQTESVLKFYDVPYDELVLYDELKWMKKPTNGTLKVNYIRELRSKGYTVGFFVEDWPETAESIEAEGVPVLCINPRYKNPLKTYL